MAERLKPEIASQKRGIKLPPAIGDWTTYRPPQILVKKVKSVLYGFDRLSKDELNDALLVHYKFISGLLRRLKIDLGLAVEFLSCQVEQTTYLNFLRTLSGAQAQGKLSITGLHETIQVFFDLNIANSIINHALGSHDLEQLNRALTDAETAAFTTALAEYLPLFADAFNAIFPDPSFSFVGSPDATLDPSVTPTSTFVAFAADAAINDIPGRIVFGYPGNSLKNLLKAYNEKKKIRPLNFGRLPAAVLNKLLIPAAACLGRTSLLNSELHRLEVGDVVSLDTSINAPAKLELSGDLSFNVQPGLRGKKKAVRLTGFGEEITIIPPLPLEEEAPPPALSEELPAEAAAEIPAAEEPSFEEEFKAEELEDEFAEDFLEEEGEGKG